MIDVRENSPAVPRNFSKAHSHTMESSSRLRAGGERAVRAVLPCVRTHRAPRRRRFGFFDGGEEKQKREMTRFWDAIVRWRTRYVHESRYTALARYVTSCHVAFTRSTGNANTDTDDARDTRRDDSSSSRAVTPRARAAPTMIRVRALLAPLHLSSSRKKRLADGRRDGSGVREPPSNKIDRPASYRAHWAVP